MIALENPHHSYWLDGYRFAPKITILPQHNLEAFGSLSWMVFSRRILPRKLRITDDRIGRVLVRHRLFGVNYGGIWHRTRRQR